MERTDIIHEENIAKILNRVVSLCKENGLRDLAEKGEKVLKNYSKSKELR